MNEYSALSSLRSQEGDYMQLMVRGQFWERVGPEDRPQAPSRQAEQPRPRGTFLTDPLPSPGMAGSSGAG